MLYRRISFLLAIIVSIELVIFSMTLYPIPFLALSAWTLWRPNARRGVILEILQRLSLALVGIFHILTIFDHPEMSAVEAALFFGLTLSTGCALLGVAILWPRARPDAAALPIQR